MADKAIALTREQRWQRYEDLSDHFPVDVVGIETVGNCNRSCGYCPVSMHPKRQGRLSTELVHGFFRQLSNLNFSKKLVFHFYNEPLLEKRIFGFVEQASRIVPRAYRLLTTNGDLLTHDSLLRLLDVGASAVAVSCHDREIYDKFTEIRENLNQADASRVQLRAFFLVGHDERAPKVTNRAGSIDVSSYRSEEEFEAGASGCDRVEFYVDYLGNVHPCCMDFSGGYVIGNIHDERIIDIWRRAVPQYRDHFVGNYKREVCRKCANVSS